MAGTEDKLTAILYRLTCPDSAELGEYHFGIVAGERSRQIKRHLGSCPHCRRELVQLQSYLTELAPELEISLAGRVKIWIARLVPDGGWGNGSAPMPAFAVRGGENGPLIYQAGDAQLTIEVQDDLEKPGHRSILGLVFGADLADMQAYLWQESKGVAAVDVDELGNFIISGLAPGVYELILSGPAVEIHVQELTI